MAYSLTHSSLVTELKRYVDNENAEFLAELPAILARGQDRCQSDLSLSMWQTSVTTSVDAANSRIERSSDWLKVFSAFFPLEGKFAERRSIDWCRACSYSMSIGVPRYFAEHDTGEIVFSPRASMNHMVVLEVLKRLPTLSEAAPTNWVSENLASMLLWSCLIECERFLVSKERVAEFTAAYQEALTAAKLELAGLRKKEYKPVSPGPSPVEAG